MNDKIDELIQGYSKGTRQKVALISALIHNPRILFMDEPLINLDPQSARLTKDIFHSLARQRVSIFMSTHIMEITECLCDHIGIVHQGELIALGTLSELNQQAALEGSTLGDVFIELTGDFDVDTKKLLEEIMS